MKRLLTTVALACVTLFAVAQNSILRPRVDIAQVESDDVIEMEVFYMNDESPRMYYLSVGNLGVGSDIVQVHFDPVYELFIPLGTSLDEAVARMEQLKTYFKMPRRTTTGVMGYFSIANPSGEMVPVTITTRRFLLTRILEFSLPTDADGVVRATHISRAEFRSLLSGVKIYRKIHPNE